MSGVLCAVVVAFLLARFFVHQERVVKKDLVAVPHEDERLVAVVKKVPRLWGELASVYSLLTIVLAFGAILLWLSGKAADDEDFLSTSERVWLLGCNGVTFLWMGFIVARTVYVYWDLSTSSFARNPPASKTTAKALEPALFHVGFGLVVCFTVHTAGLLVAVGGIVSLILA